MFDRVVCLVDGSAEGFCSLDQAAALAPSLARIVAVVPFDRYAATGARCQAGAVASAWESQAELIRTRAAAALKDRWGYARIVAGRRVAAVIKAADEEDSTLISVAAASLRRGDLRRLLRETTGAILISRAAGSGATPLLLAVGADDLNESARRVGKRLMIPLRTVVGPRPVAARAIVAESRPGDVVVIRGAPCPRRWRGSLEQAVATRAAASVLVLRAADNHGGATHSEQRAGVAER